MTVSRTYCVTEGPDLDVRATCSPLLHDLKAFSEKGKFPFLKVVILKHVCNILILSVKKEPKQCWCYSVLSWILFLAAFQCGCDQLSFIVTWSPGVVCVDLRHFLMPGNNVMRTIHGVGEMMTQMVLSRGSIFPMSMPDVPPSIHPSKQGSPTEHEDVTVMDTKLKIIEILQVCCLTEARWQRCNFAYWFNFLPFLFQITV